MEGMTEGRPRSCQGSALDCPRWYFMVIMASTVVSNQEIVNILLDYMQMDQAGFAKGHIWKENRGEHYTLQI